MKIEEIAIRLGISLLVSVIIGYERERNQSNAGVKTHTIVGVSATIIALIQVQITRDAISLALEYPELASVIRSDASRLIAQIISGIGFLGAGTIVVTKRNISGLTTAASIWSTAALGIAIGMGFYVIGGMGFITIFLVMHVLKQLLRMSTPQKIIIKHLGNDETLQYIFDSFKELNLNVRILKYDIELYHNERIVSHLFEVESSNDAFFTDLVGHLSMNASIVSVQTTNI